MGVAIDLIPLPVHPSVKIIKSEGERRTIEYTFGETVGLSLKYLIKTEADVTDLKTVVDVISLYKYNPLNTLVFGWTQSPVTVNGYPTSRYSQVKIIYHPTRSATKEIEAEVALGAVYKKHSYVVEYKPESLGVIAPKQVLEKLNVESGVAVSGEMKIILKGGSPKKYTYTLIGGHGFTGMVQKWKLHLENPEKTKICIDGKLTMPSVSLRNAHELKSQDIKMFLKNVIGFGKTCEEYSVKIDGSSSVSYEQKEMATRSISSRKCGEVRREVEELEVKLNIEYTNMPEYVREYSEVLDITIKTVLLPYMTEVESRKSHNEVIVDLKFLPHLNAFNMILTTEEGTVKYHSIRLPTYV